MFADTPKSSRVVESMRLQKLQKFSATGTTTNDSCQVHLCVILRYFECKLDAKRESITPRWKAKEFVQAQKELLEVAWIQSGNVKER